MKTRPKQIPESVRASISFANPDALDWETQARTVITAILNRGTWEAVQWAYHYYGEGEFRRTVEKPMRGMWFPQALCFWALFLKISVDPQLSKKARFHLM